jgi:hypothetical protein
VNVDTGAFEDLAAKVAELEAQLRALAQLQDVAFGTRREPKIRQDMADLRRRRRHLKAVE